MTELFSKSWAASSSLRNDCTLKLLVVRERIVPNLASALTRMRTKVTVVTLFGVYIKVVVFALYNNNTNETECNSPRTDIIIVTLRYDNCARRRIARTRRCMETCHTSFHVAHINFSRGACKTKSCERSVFNRLFIFL